MKQLQWVASSIGYLVLGGITAYAALFILAMVAAIAIPLVVMASYASFLAIAVGTIGYLGFRIMKLILE